MRELVSVFLTGNKNVFCKNSSSICERDLTTPLLLHVNVKIQNRATVEIQKNNMLNGSNLMTKAPEWHHWYHSNGLISINDTRLSFFSQL